MMQNDTSVSRPPAVGSRAAQAAARRTERQRKSAEDEIDRLLEVTLGLIEKSAPAMPSVSDIVAAAGISNHTLYRSFPSKDDLVLAVLEKGVARVVEVIDARMSGLADPKEQISAWTRGVLRQVSNVEAAKTSRTVLGHLSQSGSVAPNGSQHELLRPISDLLTAPLEALGGDTVRDGACISDLVLGAMRRYLWDSTAPSDEDIDWISEFVLGGLRVESVKAGSGKRTRQ
ncbi:TetR/AcrR family transcriptional regulator [Nocardia sp. NBC_00565]|uniref:TetR/AcrR family transcriptional regulator n=1 Tax=Nocardia sp. NBC_00565 TaxID=2975993 RepID=UPI002E8137A8|nr:TetR/AcrR family transcriptional regulator [Nocardia sp. NBC_00565]WUC06812.1 TetR/AcrR family transcriptional regulator [Nocardia sp. NBC_00565]